MFLCFLLCGLGVASELIHATKFYNIYGPLQEYAYCKQTCFHLHTYGSPSKPEPDR